MQHSDQNKNQELLSQEKDTCSELIVSLLGELLPLAKLQLKLDDDLEQYFKTIKDEEEYSDEQRIEAIRSILSIVTTNK